MPVAGLGGDSSVEVAEGEIPEETAGPFPGDGSNGPNVLTESGVVRSDITGSFGDASGVAEGVPMTVKLKVYDLNGDDATPLAGAAIYLWHCDREGSYSMYDGDAQRELPARRPGGRRRRDAGVHHDLPGVLLRPLAAHALRGLRVARRGHQRRPTSCAPRSSHCPRTSARPSTPPRATSSRSSNLAQVSLDSDGIFSDGYSLQMAKVTGSVEDGYVATLNVPV